MLIAWQNLFDSAAITAVGSQIGTLPAANLQHPHLARKWHTAAGVKASHVVFDLGAAKAAVVFAMLGTNLTAAATVRIRASTLDPNAVANLLLDTGVVNAGVKLPYGASYKFFADPNARYWRIDPADATVPDNLQIGRFFLGPAWEFNDGLEFPWSVTPLDESRVRESHGGQEHSDERPRRRVLTFAIDYKSEASLYDNAFKMAMEAGVVKQVLAVPHKAGAYLSEQAVFGRITESTPLISRKTKIFRQQFEIRESL